MMGNIGRWKYVSHIPDIEDLTEFREHSNMSEYGNLIAVLLDAERPGMIQPNAIAKKLNYPIELVLSGLKEMEDCNLVEIQAEQWRSVKEYFYLFGSEDLREYARLHEMIADSRLSVNEVSDRTMAIYEQVGRFCLHKCVGDPDSFDVAMCNNNYCPFYPYRFGTESIAYKRYMESHDQETTTP